MADAGHLGMETWCLPGWWLLPAPQRLSGHGAAAPLQPGCFFWGSFSLTCGARWLLSLFAAWQAPGSSQDPLHGHGTTQACCGVSLASTAAASWGAQLTEGLTFSAAAARRSQG